MITEDYVSFETAKLLKEKGFDAYCRTMYNAGVLCSVVSLNCRTIYNAGAICPVASLNCRWNEGYGELIEEKQNSDFGKYDNAILAPTLQMAMKWVNEEHGIYIEIRRNLNVYTFKYLIQNNGKLVSYSDWIYTTHEEACEEAIKYCIKNLI